MKYFIQFLFFTLFLNMFATFSIAMNPNKRAFDKKVTTASNKLKSFSCLFKTCQKGPFKSIEERTEHVRKHEKNTFLCTYSVCKNEGDTFSLNQTWLKHGVVKHQWCPYCPELNFNNDLHKLAEHISDSHTAKNVKKKKTFVCDLCENFLGFSKSDLEIHKKGKFCLPKKNIYECNFSNCREKFLDEKNAMNHVGSEHHACYWCQKESDGDKIFSSAIELSNHIADMGHTVGQKNIALHCYVCEECNHFTIWTDDAKRHLKNENHLKNSKISTIKEMIQEGRIGRKKSLAVSLECNFCDQSFSNNKRETISPLKNHILSKHHYCPFKGKEGYFGSCDFNLTSFSLEELSNHMSLKHKHCRQAEVKSVWCNNCNYIAFTTNRPHNCRVKDKNLSTDNDDLFENNEKNNFDINLLLLSNTKKCCDYNITIINNISSDNSDILYDKQQLKDKININFKNHLMYKHNACISCFESGIFDSFDNLLIHLDKVHNLEHPEQFIFENNDKFYCCMCIQNSLQLSPEDLFDHIEKLVH